MFRMRLRSTIVFAVALIMCAGVVSLSWASYWEVCNGRCETSDACSGPVEVVDENGTPVGCTWDSGEKTCEGTCTKICHGSGSTQYCVYDEEKICIGDTSKGYINCGYRGTADCVVNAGQTNCTCDDEITWDEETDCMLPKCSGTLPG